MAEVAQLSNTSDFTKTKEFSTTKDLDKSTSTKEPLSTRLRKSFKLGSPRDPAASPREGNIISRLAHTLSTSLHNLVTPRPNTELNEADIPEVYLNANNGNRKKAFAKWQDTKKWREENKMDTCLERPHTKYEAIKNYYPQVLQGRGINNEIVTLEMPARMDLAGLKKNNISAADLAMHIAICFEYLIKEVDNTAPCFTIMDLKDLSLTKCVSIDYIAIMKAVSDVVEDHYPGKLVRILIINPPRMFGTVFGVIKGVLPASVRDGMQILYNVQELHKFVKPDQLPKAYGGTGPEFGQSQLELEGRKYFLSRVEAAAKK